MIYRWKKFKCVWKWHFKKLFMTLCTKDLCLDSWGMIFEGLGILMTPCWLRQSSNMGVYGYAPCQDKEEVLELQI